MLGRILAVHHWQGVGLWNMSWNMQFTKQLVNHTSQVSLPCLLKIAFPLFNHPGYAYKLASSFGIVL
jgi:hypothetical protein